jgi:hypothetical protein
MKSISSTQLLTDLTHTVNDLMREANALKELPMAAITSRPQPGAWNALECLEHLNLYGDFYLPEIERRIARAKAAPEKMFTSGWLGNYFAESMSPKQPVNKVKTFKDKNPINLSIGHSAIDRFIEQQARLLQLLEKARTVNLAKTRTSITLASWITLRLGDTFRFIIYHEQRHMIQARRAAGLLI